MKAHFKNPRVIDGKHYEGHTELDNAFADHWYFKQLVKDGDVSILDEDGKESHKNKEISEDPANDLAEPMKADIKGNKEFHKEPTKPVKHEDTPGAAPLAATGFDSTVQPKDPVHKDLKDESVVGKEEPASSVNAPVTKKSKKDA